MTKLPKPYINFVELSADKKECAYDQKCRFGYRVEQHAVYCHNDAWKNGPRKCKKTWFWGPKVKGDQDEDCCKFKPHDLTISK